MRVFEFKYCLPVVLLILLGCYSTWAQSNDNNAPLTNASIVKLVKAGFKEKSIITIIGSKPVNFDLSTDRMIELKRNGVTEKVILAMMARQEGEMFSDDDWGDDSTFKSSPDTGSTGMDRQGNASNGSSTDIFGSRAGSRGAVKTRNGNGSTSGEVETTGSATVRIIRPPSEAGANPKLEKTPTLNNDSVVELVEAGFSEGTIIRRIEQSPVNFDLSKDKIAELRKHRVSEKVIVAMKTAMGEESSPSTSSTSVSPKTK